MPQDPGVDAEATTGYVLSGSRFPKHTRCADVGRPFLKEKIIIKKKLVFTKKAK